MDIGNFQESFLNNYKKKDFHGKSHSSFHIPYLKLQ